MLRLAIGRIALCPPNTWSKVSLFAESRSIPPTPAYKYLLPLLAIEQGSRRFSVC
jgi:hypothetical protein